MAINKNSNGYTFLFAIVMVVLVGAILASLSLSLKPMQKANAGRKEDDEHPRRHRRAERARCGRAGLPST